MEFEDFDLDLEYLIPEETKSPVKKNGITHGSIPKLPPTNELFQITNNSNYKNHNLFGVEDTFDENKLKNNKIEKLIKELETDDFEMEKGRSRIFKGRIKGLEMEDDVDDRILNYLNDKENVEPIKSPIRSNKVKKPLKPLTSNLQMPVLKPLTNSLNTNFQSKLNVRTKRIDQHKRICKPNHHIKRDLKPSIVYKQDPCQIFLVDSLTGSLNDATQFGTELNASNCEGFPLPENIHEVVQIPTNEDSKGPKMAIIKTFNSKYYSNGSDTSVSGFYSKLELQNYLKTLHTTSDTGVEVVGQSFNEYTPTPLKGEKTVKFADDNDIEW